MWGLIIVCLRAWGKIPFPKEKLMSFNNTEDNSLGKDIKIVFTLLTSVDVLVIEAVSSFLISIRDNKLKEHNCLFANGGKSGHSVAWIDAKIMKKNRKLES